MGACHTRARTCGQAGVPRAAGPWRWRRLGVQLQVLNPPPGQSSSSVTFWATSRKPALAPEPAPLGWPMSVFNPAASASPTRCSPQTTFPNARVSGYLGGTPWRRPTDRLGGAGGSRGAEVFAKFPLSGCTRDNANLGLGPRTRGRPSPAFWGQWPMDPVRPVRAHSPGPAGRHPVPRAPAAEASRGSPCTPGGRAASSSSFQTKTRTGAHNFQRRRPETPSAQPGAPGAPGAPAGLRGAAAAGDSDPATWPSGPATPAPPEDPGALRLPASPPPAIPGRSGPRSRVRHHLSRETRAARGAAGPGAGGSAGGGVRRPGGWPWAVLTVAVVLLHGAGAGADAGLRARLAARPSRPAASAPARLCRAPSPAPGPRLPPGAPPAAARARTPGTRPPPGPRLRTRAKAPPPPRGPALPRRRRAHSPHPRGPRHAAASWQALAHARAPRPRPRARSPALHPARKHTPRHAAASWPAPASARPPEAPPFGPAP